MLPAEAKAVGLTSEMIRADTVSILQAADIKVASYSDWYDLPGSPYLFIGIGVLKNPTSPTYATTVHLELRQIATLERAPDTSFHVATWTRGETIFAEESMVESDVRNLLKDWIEMFIYDYSTANHKLK
jgi:hypothetical protein